MVRDTLKSAAVARIFEGNEIAVFLMYPFGIRLYVFSGFAHLLPLLSGVNKLKGSSNKNQTNNQVQNNSAAGVPIGMSGMPPHTGMHHNVMHMQGEGSNTVYSDQAGLLGKWKSAVVKKRQL